MVGAISISKRARQGASCWVDSTPILIEALRYPILLPARDEPTEHGLVGNLMYSVFGEWGCRAVGKRDKGLSLV